MSRQELRSSDIDLTGIDIEEVRPFVQGGSTGAAEFAASCGGCRSCYAGCPTACISCNHVVLES